MSDSSEVNGKGLLIKADSIAATFRDEVKRSLAECSRPPKLVGILATSSAPSRYYAEFTKKQCDDLGVEFILKKTGAADTGELGEGEGVEEAIIEANEDDTVGGIMVGISACLIFTLLNISRTLDLRCIIRSLEPNRFVEKAIFRCLSVTDYHTM